MARRWMVLLALVLLLKHEAAPARAPSRHGLLEGETLRDLPDLPAAESLPEREPTHLTGHVYGPDGSPVAKAEVRVVYPKTYELVRTGPDGFFELPFERHGRFLVEAALTIELAPERCWVEVPEYGDPGPVDFHLKPAGAIFGEVTLAGIPVEDAGVELYATDIFGDEELVHDTSARNGYFNFYFDPPKDVPLRIDVKSVEGILRAPLRFTWTGEQFNAGSFDLTPYPGLRIRMRLPDGTYAKEVLTARREDLASDGGGFFPESYIGKGSRVFIPAEHDVIARLVFLAWPAESEGEVPFMVEREVQLLFGRPRELELIVRPGPLPVVSRLLDTDERGVRGRLRCGESVAATGDSGLFKIEVPHGGLNTLVLDALDVPGAGWVELAKNGSRHAFLLDADDPGDCTFETGSRILLLATPPFSFGVDHGAGEGRAEWSTGAYEEESPAYLSPRLEPGPYRWAWDDTNGWLRTGDIQVAKDGITVVDLR